MLNLIPKAQAAGINLADQLVLQGGGDVRATYDTPAVFVNLVVRNIFVAAGVVLFFMIIAAGYSFMQGEGKGLEQSKTMITGAVIGFLVMFGAYWIVQIIAELTGTNIPL